MNDNSQLIKKQGEGYKNVYPLTYVQSIVDAESNEKLSDILVKYNHLYITWKGSQEDTRLSIPILLRKHGLWISYDMNGSLYTEWYKGPNIVSLIDNNWKDSINWEMIPNLQYIEDASQRIPTGAILPEMLSPALQQLLAKQHVINNCPDDEDLESKCNVLRFKDRTYNPNIASGKGYKVLRKNWVKGRNVLTQDMINQPNTIYEIRYDYDLNGATIDIPVGCTLQFTGGSLDNGLILGNSTIVSSSSVCFHFNNILGSFDYLDIDWFSNKSWNIVDAIINRTKTPVIDFKKNNIICDFEINISRPVFITNLNVQSVSTAVYSVLKAQDVKDLSICNIHINCNNNAYCAISLLNCKCAHIDTVYIRNVGSEHINVTNAIELKGDCSSSTISNFNIENVSSERNSSGITIAHKDGISYSSNVSIISGIIKNITSVSKDDADGIKVLEQKGDEYHDSYHIFRDITFDNCQKRGLKLQCSYTKCYNIICLNDGFSQALIDFFGDDPYIDGLIARNINLNNITYGIYINKYAKAYIANVEVTCSSVFKNNKTLIYHNASASSTSVLDVSNVHNNGLGYLYRHNPSSLSGRATFKNITHIVNYNISIESDFNYILLTNISTDTNAWREWYSMLKADRDATNIKSDYFFGDALNMVIKNGHNSEFSGIAYSKTSAPCVTYCRNGKISVVGDSNLIYPHSRTIDYTGMISNDTITRNNEYLFTCIEPPVEGSLGKWRIDILNMNGKNRAELKQFTDNPSIYTFANPNILDSVLKKYIFWNGTAWTNLDGTTL